MEEQKDMSGMLEMVPQPAFFVNNGMITIVNQAAQHLLIEENTPVEPLLGQYAQEYLNFSSGCLYLQLELSSCPYHTSVRRLGDCDLFVIDHEAEQAELQAMALAATELREPISDIMAVTDLLFPSGEVPNDPATQLHLARMNRRLSQLNRMLSNMSYAIQYTGNTPARMSCQDVCAVIAEVFEHAQTLVATTGIQLTYSGPREAIPCMIAAERLERAIYNILSNSMKHCAPGDSIVAKLYRRDNKLYLSIQDSGSGIPDHILSNVFTRFRRAPSLDSSGLGLGLVLVRGAAAAHGGTVLIDQPTDGGTRVTLSIAIKKPTGSVVRSPLLNADYTGEHDHGLTELSDVLPLSLYYKT